MKGIEDLYKWRDFLCSWIKYGFSSVFILYIVLRCQFFPTLQVQMKLSQNPSKLFFGNEKIILKFMWENQNIKHGSEEEEQNRKTDST